MRTRSWFVIAIAASLPVGLDVCARGPGGEPPRRDANAPITAPSPTHEAEADSPGFAQQMLTAHNRVRANAVPTPSPPLPPLRWSPDLAARAQEWADTCPSGHRPNREIRLQGRRGNMGENIGWRGASSRSPAAVVEAWAAEVSDYDHASNRCGESRRSCYHYTQIVWRDSALLGCGVRRGCTTRHPTVYVCNYFPAGNLNMPHNRPY